MKLRDGIIAALTNEKPGVIMIPDFIDFRVLRKRVYAAPKKEKTDEKASKS